MVPSLLLDCANHLVSPPFLLLKLHAQILYANHQLVIFMLMRICQGGLVMLMRLMMHCKVPPAL
uniref:Uncharacterized protein n=1 Tax=Arundo donax TaxID=35708 RepID=A0A0A9FJ85_ARUDO